MAPPPSTKCYTVATIYTRTVVRTLRVSLLARDCLSLCWLIFFKLYTTQTHLSRGFLRKCLHQIGL